MFSNYELSIKSSSVEEKWIHAAYFGRVYHRLDQLAIAVASLRISFIEMLQLSHHLSWFDDENRTALWAGNSPRIIHKHYRGLVSSTDAESFWTMVPTALKQEGIAVKPPDGGEIRRA